MLCFIPLVAQTLLTSFTSIFTAIVENRGRNIAGTSGWSAAAPFALMLSISEALVFGLEKEYFESVFSIYALTIGFVVAKLCSRLILAYMAKSDFEMADSAFIAPAFLLVNRCCGLYFCEYHMLWICFTWTVIDLAWFYVNVYSDFRELLGVDLFKAIVTINPVEKKEKYRK